MTVDEIIGALEEAAREADYVAQEDFDAGKLEEGERSAHTADVIRRWANWKRHVESGATELPNDDGVDPADEVGDASQPIDPPS